MDETILLAEDEDSIADVVAILLEDEGYRVLRAEDGDSSGGGVALLREAGGSGALRAKKGAGAPAWAGGARPALVLPEVGIPPMPACELPPQLRARETVCGPPIILCPAVPPP